MNKNGSLWKREKAWNRCCKTLLGCSFECYSEALIPNRVVWILHLPLNKTGRWSSLCFPLDLQALWGVWLAPLLLLLGIADRQLAKEADIYTEGRLSIQILLHFVFAFGNNVDVPALFISLFRSLLINSCWLEMLNEFWLEANCLHKTPLLSQLFCYT